MMEENGAKKRMSRGTRILLIIFIVIIAVTLALVAAVLILSRSGAASLADGDAAPKITSGPAPEESAQPGGEVLEEYTVRRNGKLYRAKENVTTLLLVGADKADADSAQGGGYNADVRADVVMLAVLDGDANKISFVSISRDTICEFDMCDENGSYTGRGSGQLALSFRYGDGAMSSCRATEKAVSEMLFDLPIHGAAVLYIDGVGVINDAVGGVTLTPTESLGSLRAGVETTLTGTQAELYIRYREMTETGNLERMQRQKQYFLALASRAAAKIKSEPTSVIGLYNAASPYLATDLGINEIVYLASRAAGMEFSGEVYTLPGEVRLSEDNYAEYILDEDGVQELIMQLYYEELSQTP